MRAENLTASIPLAKSNFSSGAKASRHGQTRMPYTNAPRYVGDDAALKQGQRFSLMPVGLNSLPRLRRLLCRQRPFLDTPPIFVEAGPLRFAIGQTLQRLENVLAEIAVPGTARGGAAS